MLHYKTLYHFTIDISSFNCMGSEVHQRKNTHPILLDFDERIVNRTRTML